MGVSRVGIHGISEEARCIYSLTYEDGNEVWGLILSLCSALDSSLRTGESASSSSVFPPEHQDKTFPNPESEVTEPSLERPEKAIEID